MLSPFRVIDLTDDRGQLCGQILGDLGAEVVLVEPPGGSPSRRIGPFANDSGNREESLWFWSYNRGKRSVIADIETTDGQQRIRDLAAGADFLIESFPPGYMAERRIGYQALRELNPRLIFVSITPFGQTGPRANWAASDLTVLASSGVLQITGDDDRPPVRLALAQAFLHAGAEAAAAAMVAHAARERDGLGQHVDVSAQTATMMATQSYALAHAWKDTSIARFAGGLKVGPITLRFIQPAKDGWVSVTFLFGTAIGPFTRRLMEVMCEQGFVDEATRDKDWINYTALVATGQEPVTELARCIEAIGEFTKSHTKAELLELAFKDRLLIVPVSTTDDLLHSPHLAAREFWTTIEHEGRGELKYPGAFAKFSATALKLNERAPRLGEHDSAVAPRAVPAVRSPSPSKLGNEVRPLPLAGVKVLDFMWVMAGPAGSRYLADYGATQIKVESATKVDTARTLSPFYEAVPGPERSLPFITFNAGKLGLQLNLSTEAGRALALRLVQWADVVTESYTPRAMRSWGLDYESLRNVKPDIIMLSSCLGGQSGPWCELAGFGTMGAQLAGFGELAGWPDSIPAGPFGAYTDYIAPKFTAAAILAALDHRRRTGEGQYIDLAQAECSQHFIAPAFLDLQINGRIAMRRGNVSDEYAPHAVFPCEGVDKWVAIVAENDAQWAGLRAAMGNPAWSAPPAYATLPGRLASRERLEAHIADWTRPRTQDEAETLLQANGVPVFRSATSEDISNDPQLAHRKHIILAEHADLGPVPIENSRFILSDTPARISRAGPTFAQDNEYVLREILRLSDDEVVDLIAAGALE